MTPTPYLPPVPSDYDDAMHTDAHENGAARDEAREELASIEAERLEDERREGGEW